MRHNSQCYMGTSRLSLVAAFLVAAFFVAAFLVGAGFVAAPPFLAMVLACSVTDGLSTSSGVRVVWCARDGMAALRGAPGAPLSW